MARVSATKIVDSVQDAIAEGDMVVKGERKEVVWESGE